jgi:hypothetical protein
MSSDICMVPLPNFTTCPNEETDEETDEEIGKFEKFWAILKLFAKLLRKIFIPINPSIKNSEDEPFSPFLQVEKYNSPFFYIPSSYGSSCKFKMESNKN